MRARDLKLLRDFRRLGWQAAAIALLIACGVAVSVMAFSAQSALRSAQAGFYADTRFADLFAQARRAPESLGTEILAIDGVLVVDLRLREVGLMPIPGQARPAALQLISLPRAGETGLNLPHLVQGRMPAAEGEVVALKAFLDAARLAPGEALPATVRGRPVQLRIVGAVEAPEYVFSAGPGSFLPDNAHNAVLWADRDFVGRASGMGAVFDTVALDLADGASAPAVAAALDRLLELYGGRGAVARADQPSHAMLEAELRELSLSATLLPPIFLLVASALVHMVMGRLVDAEREQIGLLKAFGFTDGEVAEGYLKLSAAIGAAGGLAGGLAGWTLGALIMGLYEQYFRLPDLQPSFNVAAFVASLAISVGAAVAGSLLAVRRAVALSPSVAMRPPPPAVFHRGLALGLGRLRPIDEATRILLRNLTRFPGRAVLGGAGLAASLALLVSAQSMFASLDRLVEHAAFRTQRWNHSLTFLEARSLGSRTDVATLPGVLRVEPVRNAEATISGRGQSRRVMISGIDPDGRLQRPLDSLGRAVPLQGGVVISAALAERLDVRPGDPLHLRLRDGARSEAVVRLAALSEDYSGYGVYMPRRRLNMLLGEGEVVTGAHLLVDPLARAAFYRSIARTPQVVGLLDRDEAIAGLRMAMIDAMRTSMTFYMGFAAAIGLGVAFNLARIGLSERARDLATLRILGFDRIDCAYVLLGELLILTLAAIPFGLLGGAALSRGLAWAYAREELRLPLEVSPGGMSTALIVYGATILAAALLVGRRVWGLNLVAVLKSRD